jgi:hypothetical protein
MADKKLWFCPICAGPGGPLYFDSRPCGDAIEVAVLPVAEVEGLRSAATRLKAIEDVAVELRNWIQSGGQTAGSEADVLQRTNAVLGEEKP